MLQIVSLFIIKEKQYMIAERLKKIALRENVNYRIGSPSNVSLQRDILHKV